MLKNNITHKVTRLSVVMATVLYAGTVLAEVHQHQINIPAQRLDLALQALAQQSGAQILFVTSIANTQSSTTLSGQLTVEQALAQLLKDKNLQVKKIAENKYSIVQTVDKSLYAGELQQLEIQSKESDNVAQLPSINVQAQAPIGTRHVDGYIAKKSITATKIDIPLLESPQTVNTVTTDQMSIQNPSTLNEALSYVAGVSAMGSAAEKTSDIILIRGFNTSTAAPIYFNGTKLYRNAFSGVAEPFGLERIEILKGPASVLYGSAAPGGIVNLISKLPETQSHGEVQGQYGSHDRKQIAVDLTDAVNQKQTVSYRLTALMRDSDSYIDFIPDNRHFLQGALTWRPNDKLVLSLIANYQHNEMMYSYGLPYSGTVSSNPNGQLPPHRFVGDPNFDHYDTTNYTTALLLSYQLNDHITLRQNILGFHSQADWGYTYYLDYESDQRTVSRGLYGRRDQDKTFTIDNQLELKWKNKLWDSTTLFGVDYTHNIFNLAAYLGTISSLDLYAPVYGVDYELGADTQDYQQTTEQIGIYAQQHLKYADKWVVNFGGRYDAIKSKTENYLTDVTSKDYDDSQFTGRIGLVRLFENGFAPYLSYAQSFEPSSGTAYDGSSFKPTEGEQYEAGIRYMPQNKPYSLSALYYDLTQVNVTTTDLSHPQYSIQEGEVRSKGVEVEGRFKLAEGTNLLTSYGYIDNKVIKSYSGTTGNRYAATPRQTATLWLDHLFREKYQAGVGIRYFGDSTDLGNTVALPGFTLVDAVLALQLDSHIKLSVNFKNIFNKEYLTCTYSCFYGETRSVTGTLSYKW
jgi:iron complex outermembrane receptor protein